MDAGWTTRLPLELQPFWTHSTNWLFGPDLPQAVLHSLRSQRSSWPEVSVESQFIRHQAGYFLGPHSDLYTELVAF